MQALILGVDGQDGSYLAEFLLARRYQVTGWLPSAVPVSLDRIAHLVDDPARAGGDLARPSLRLVYGDLADQQALLDLFADLQPDEVYNLAAPSYPAGSWEIAVQLGNIAGLGAARLLEALRQVRPAARFYQASSSEMFGEPLESPQSESTPFHPRNPYGIAKLYAHWTVVNYRQHYNLYAVSGIMYNHESPRRGLEFVTRKITHTAARIKLGLAENLSLGNLDARRDWGFAGDYVHAMWAMLQQESPEDLVLGTGQVHTVRNFCEQAFACLGLDYRLYVSQEPAFYRPTEPLDLVANPARAQHKIGWNPPTGFEQLVRLMVEHDLELCSRQRIIQQAEPASAEDEPAEQAQSTARKGSSV